MRGNQTIVINGKVYDAITGLPVAAPITAPKVSVAQPAMHTAPATEPKKSVAVTPNATASRPQHHAKSAHRVAQKSVTLRRDALKKPVTPAHAGTARRKPAPGHIARSEAITKFAPHPQTLQHTQRLDFAPVKQPSHQQPHSIVAQKHALVAQKPATSSAQKLNSRA